MAPSPPTSSLRAKIPDHEYFLKNISSTDPVGPSLRYGSLYDEVRLNRQEDDPRLSMGIWKTELRRADWSKIESLCLNALLTESKDLQIAAWLTEAWASIDGVKGYTRGIQTLLGLCETFWEAIHPQPQDGNDMENRQMIFEWLDSALSARLMAVNLTESKYDQTAFGLGFYKSVQHSDASQKRVENTTSANRKIDPSKTIGTVDDFQKSLDQTPDTFLIQQHQNVIEASNTTQAFKAALISLLGNASPSFSRILGTLKEMERILSTALQSRKPPPPLEPVTPSEPGLISESYLETMPVSFQNLTNREEAYRQLDIIATFLEQNDPHSLAPQILRQLIRWKQENIADILQEIAKTPEEYEILMKILGTRPIK